MKAIALTNKGLEDVSASEIQELIKSNVEIKDGFVIFDFDKYQDLFLLCYKGRSFNKIILLIDNLLFNTKEDINKELNQIEFSDWIDDDFCVNGLRFGNHDFNSFDMQKYIGEIISKKHSSKLNLKNPKIIFFFLIINNEFYFGIDLCKEDLGKRDYRIFISRENLKGNEAFALIKLVDYDNKKTLLDPFCRSGIIPIEAALYACHFSVNYYNKEKFLFLKLKKFKDFDFDNLFQQIDKKIKLDTKTKIISTDETFNNVQAAKKNAKISGIIKKIDFSRTDVYWIDMKFEPKSIDLIITMPPQISSNVDESKIEKKYKDLFNNAKEILSKDGKIIIALKRGIDIIKKYSLDFKIIHERIFHQGEDKINVFVFEKNK